MQFLGAVAGFKGIYMKALGRFAGKLGCYAVYKVFRVVATMLVCVCLAVVTDWQGIFMWVLGWFAGKDGWWLPGFC